MVEHAYIHIPFCKRKCKYCDFVSGKNIKDKDVYIEALLNEIKSEYKGEELKTLYFGGGTPSLLSAKDIEKIKNCFSLAQEAEITLEANPETVTSENFKMLKAIGINRISLGVQSFDNNILKIIGREHNEEIILNAINNIKSAGFKNISIDLIYGLPTQTLEMFRIDLKKALNLDIQHISTYGLKIEEYSFFGKHLPENLPDDELQAEMFLYLCDFLKNNDFEHYEISNFAKKGFYSRHNCSYWKNKEYYGFGLNASGYINNIRYKNISNLEKYISNPLIKEENSEIPINEKFENEIFLALRLNSGVDIEEINHRYNIDFKNKYKKIIEKYQNLELLEIKNGHCKLTEKGILLSNDVMCEFLS